MNFEQVRAGMTLTTSFGVVEVGAVDRPSRALWTYLPTDAEVIRYGRWVDWDELHEVRRVRGGSFKASEYAKGLLDS